MGHPNKQEFIVQIKNLVLIASFFAIGCGDKSDEDRLDDLVEACEAINAAHNELADSCDALTRNPRNTTKQSIAVQ